MTEVSEIDDFDAQVAALETTLGQATSITAAFSGEVQKMQGAMAATSRDAEALSRGLSRGLRRAFDGVVFDGMKLSDALTTVASSMVNAAYGAAIRPVTTHLGDMVAQGVSGLFGGAFADGAAFSQGRVMPFAKGGVVSRATAFPVRGGIGLMGEAGPEAILPLARGSDGALGVRAEGGDARPVTVVMNVSTPDAASFQRSRSQIAAQMTRALTAGRRNA